MSNTKEEIMESQDQLSQTQQQGRGTTFLRTCFNGLNAVSGVGILSIPYAVSEGGWLSLIILLLVAILCWYTGLLLRRCMDAHPLIKTYPDIGDLAFGCKGRALVSILMYLELYLVAVEFLILEGDNLEKLFPNTGFKIGGKQGFVLLTAFIILPTTWLRNLGIMAYVSAGGVLASIILVACVLWVGAVDGVGFHERGMLLNWGGLPTAMSLYTFCYCGHAVFPTLFNSMKDRSQFSMVKNGNILIENFHFNYKSYCFSCFDPLLVLVVCFLISTVIYGSMAVLGYLMYGDQLKSQVTLNLPVRKLSTKVAIYTTLINPLTKYVVIITPIATAIEDTPHLRKSRPLSILVRSVLVISTVIVALTIPFFGFVMAFTGSFLSVTVSMLLPCLCYLKINKAAQSLGLEVMVIAGILFVGTLVGVVGTFTSLKQIVTHL